MLKKTLPLIILVSSFSCCLNAQVSGYLGNRFYIGYNQGLSVINLINGVNYNRAIKLFPTFTPSVNYVVNNHSALALNYTFGKTSFSSTSYFTSNNPQFYNEKVNYTTHSITLDHKIFSKSRNALAPVGNYFSYGFSFQAYKYGDYATEFQDPITGNYPYQTITSSDFNVHVGVGRQYVFAKRLLLNVGGQLTLPMFSIRQMILANTQIEQTAATQNFLYQLFRMNIGLSILLF